MQHHPKNTARAWLFATLLSLLVPPARAGEAAKNPPHDAKESSAPSTLPSEATPISLAQVRKLQRQLQETSALSVDFTQTIYKDLRKKTSTSEGKAYFAKPKSFRWILEKPKGDEWIFDGGDLVNYQPAAKRATRYGAAAGKGRELMQIVDMVLNFDALLAQYKMERAWKIADAITLQLEPMKPDDIVAAELTLDLKLNYISSVRLVFRGNNHTTFAFTNPRKEALGQAVFHLPAGVEVSSAL